MLFKLGESGLENPKIWIKNAIIYVEFTKPEK